MSGDVVFGVRGESISMSATTADRMAALAGSAGKLRISRHGAHWFERTTGLNALVEELRFPQDAWARAPRYVSIALTNACELHCPFCYAPKIPGRLEADAVIKWTEELDRSGGLGVGFGGGEPTAHPRFAWLCKEISHRTRLAVTFTTHAHRIDEELALRLRGSVHFIRVSVDGVGATYERLRGRPFSALRQRVGIVTTIAPFGLNMVVTDETVRELDAVSAFAGDVGAEELLLLPEQPTTGSPGLGAAGMHALREWVTFGRTGLRLTIARSAASAELPLAEPFGSEPELEAHAHVDALGVLRRDAYSVDGVQVGESILGALDQLRRRCT
jgi:sulfatase maturation enzyme AslB (radical SAM superfamily)